VEPRVTAARRRTWTASEVMLLVHIVVITAAIAIAVQVLT
jgi:hypothetical protein